MRRAMDLTMPGVKVDPPPHRVMIIVYCSFSNAFSTLSRISATFMPKMIWILPPGDAAVGHVVDEVLIDEVRVLNVHAETRKAVLELLDVVLAAKTCDQVGNTCIDALCGSRGNGALLHCDRRGGLALGNGLGELGLLLAARRVEVELLDKEGEEEEVQRGVDDSKTSITGQLVLSTPRTRLETTMLMMPPAVEAGTERTLSRTRKMPERTRVNDKEHGSVQNTRWCPWARSRRRARR